MKLVKGSLQAKRYMASIRSKKKRSIGAVGDYAKFEIAVIKKLATLLKQPYKKTQETVNTSETLLKIISVNFDKKISVNETAKQLKLKLIEVNKKSPIQSFIELLSKLPKKETQSKVKFPIKLPATVTIGSVKKNMKKLGSVKESSALKKTLKAKKLYMPHGYATAKRKRKIGEIHNDTKSHNVKINVLSGDINKGRNELIKNLSYLYGKLASDYLFATTIRAKKSIQKELSIVKKELNKLKGNTGFYQ